MKKIIKAATAVAGLACLSACATAPATYSVNNSRVVPEGKDVVWERVVEYFASNNLSIKTIEKDSGLIAAERMIGTPRQGGDLAGWASCGSSALEIAVAQSVDLNVFVRPASGGTNVTVNTNFTERRQMGQYPATTVTCNSNGKLETRLLDAASGR